MRLFISEPNDFMEPFGTDEQISILREQLAIIAAKTGIPYKEILSMPTDLREDLMVAVMKSESDVYSRTGEALNILLTSLRKMFTGKRK